jgi:hypothetical protein
MLALIPTLPDVVTGYGWSLRPYTCLEWYRRLGSISVASVNPLRTCNKVFTCLPMVAVSIRQSLWGA